MHDTSTFISIDEDQDIIFKYDPPYNCYTSQLCAAKALKEKVTTRKSAGSDSIDCIACGGVQYHLDDFVLYRSKDNDGPAHIGYITGIKVKKAAKVRLRRVGRLNTHIAGAPIDAMKDEVRIVLLLSLGVADSLIQRQVYLTDEEVIIGVESLLQVCFVFHLEAFGTVNLDQWLSLSENRFYIRYTHPTLLVNTWNDLEEIACHELPVCTPCVKKVLECDASTEEFLEDTQRHPLKTLDLFAGVGAFSLGLTQGSCSMKLTHAVEISPSASATLR